MIAVKEIWMRVAGRELDLIGTSVIDTAAFVLHVDDDEREDLRRAIATAIATVATKADGDREDQLIAAFTAGCLMGATAEQMYREEAARDA